MRCSIEWRIFFMLKMLIRLANSNIIITFVVGMIGKEHTELQSLLFTANVKVMLKPNKNLHISILFITFASVKQINNNKV